MTRTVWMYQFEFGATEAVFSMPGSAKVRHVALQNERPTLWAELDPSWPKGSLRRFRLVGTGHEFEIPDGWVETLYVGTVHYEQVGLVFHIYELHPDLDTVELPT